MDDNNKLKCPLCKSELTIKRSSTIEHIIASNVWTHESIESVALTKIKRRVDGISKMEFDPSFKYHTYVCFNCGFIHDGIKNMSSIF